MRVRCNHQRGGKHGPSPSSSAPFATATFSASGFTYIIPFKRYVRHYKARWAVNQTSMDLWPMNLTFTLVVNEFMRLPALTHTFLNFSEPAYSIRVIDGTKGRGEEGESRL